MGITVQLPLFLLRNGSFKKKPSKKGRQKRSENEKYLRCCVCENKITKLSQKIEVQGGFEHNFLNPGGKVFRIGCFHDARGCFNIGTPSTEWSWFQGYSWQVSNCRQCMAHLGWCFSRHEKPDFFGLILETLI